MAAGGAGGCGARQRRLDRAYRLRAGAVTLGHGSSRKLIEHRRDGQPRHVDPVSRKRAPVQ